MTTQEVLDELYARGLSLALVDGRLLLCGTPYPVTSQLLAVLGWHWAGLARFALPLPPECLPAAPGCVWHILPKGTGSPRRHP